MPILIALILAPTMTFYFYVLVQFFKEANRRRQHLTWAGIVPLPSARVREAQVDLRLAKEPALGANASAVAAPAHVAPTDGAPTGPSAPANVIATYLKNRWIVMPSGTERLAVKRQAKG
jgi:hypothetical protein